MENIHGKAMSRWVQSIMKIVARRLEADAEEKEILFVKTPPPVEWHLTRDKQEFSLMTLHPIEIARQITLIESGRWGRVLYYYSLQRPLDLMTRDSKACGY